MMNDDSRTNEEYRRVLATANKLETIQSNLDSVIDFFLAPIVKLYTKLCNDCVKLFFEYEFKLDQYRKAEELIWRRIYHDIYKFHKTKRQVIRKQDECLMESHFVSGIGFYSYLIVKLRSHYNIYDVRGVIAPLNLNLGPIDNLITNRRLNEENERRATNNGSSLEDSETVEVNALAQQWARQAIYRSLVYMGDLARYLLEISQHDYRKLAFSFYLAASRFQPDQGLPFNQLATLSGGFNHNLDAVCNYMRCCLRPKAFEGAEGNMRKIFDFNIRSYEELGRGQHYARISQVLASKDPTASAESLIKTVIVAFIKLTSGLWLAITGDFFNDAILQSVIIDETKLFFEILREAIELEPIVPLATTSYIEQNFNPISGGSNYRERPKYISPTIMYEFCSISLMLIAKCRKRQSSGSDETDVIADLVNTVALNLLHYATSRCQKMIQSKVHELRMNLQDLANNGKGSAIKQSIGKKKIAESPCGFNNRSSENINSSSEAMNRRAQSRLRQRRAATNYSDGLQKIKQPAYHNDDSDLSDLEETALSTIDALEISSEMSDENDCNVDDLINLDSSDEDKPEGYNVSPCINRLTVLNKDFSKPGLRPTRSQNYEPVKNLNLTAQSSSLPVAELLTNVELSEKVHLRVIANSQSPSESSDLDVRETTTAAVTIYDSFQANSSNNLETMLVHIYNQTYLPTIKIYFDWLLSDGEIINSNLTSFQSYLGVLRDIVTLLDDLQKLSNPMRDLSMLNPSNVSLDLNYASVSESSIFKHFFTGPEWIQKYPLSCDYPLLGLEPLKGVHDLNIDFKHNRELVDFEAGFVTIQCITAFSHALAVFLENKVSQQF